MPRNTYGILFLDSQSSRMKFKPREVREPFDISCEPRPHENKADKAPLRFPANFPAHGPAQLFLNRAVFVFQRVIGIFVSDIALRTFWVGRCKVLQYPQNVSGFLIN